MFKRLGFFFHLINTYSLSLFLTLLIGSTFVWFLTFVWFSLSTFRIIPILHTDMNFLHFLTFKKNGFYLISILISCVNAYPYLKALSIILTAFALLDHNRINDIHKEWQIIRGVFILGCKWFPSKEFPDPQHHSESAPAVETSCWTLPSILYTWKSIIFLHEHLLMVVIHQPLL